MGLEGRRKEVREVEREGNWPKKGGLGPCPEIWLSPGIVGWLPACSNGWVIVIAYHTHAILTTGRFFSSFVHNLSIVLGQARKLHIVLEIV